LRKKSQQSGKENVSSNTWSRQLGHDITPSSGPLSMEDAYIRGIHMEAPSGMLARDATWFVDQAGIMRGPAEV